jgi:hypothetical protein
MGSTAGSRRGGDADAGGSNPAWPVPTTDATGRAQVIYALHIPASTNVLVSGSTKSWCDWGSYGFDSNAEFDNGIVAFTVMFDCASESVDRVEQAADFQYVDSATAPFQQPWGYVRFDPNHYAWELYTDYQDGIADACQNWQSSFYEETGNFPYAAQRMWSNKAALHGHDPCVPAASGTYHGMTLFPSQEATVSVDLTSAGRAKVTTLGYNVTAGTPLTFQVGYFSDAPSSPWTISSDFPVTTNLYDSSRDPIGNGAATVTIDKVSGQNGDIANVTVNVTQKGDLGFHVMAITWDPAPPLKPHYLPIMLVDQ